MQAMVLDQIAPIEQSPLALRDVPGRPARHRGRAAPSARFPAGKPLKRPARRGFACDESCSSRCGHRADTLQACDPGGQAECEQMNAFCRILAVATEVLIFAGGAALMILATGVLL